MAVCRHDAHTHTGAKMIQQMPSSSGKLLSSIQDRNPRTRNTSTTKLIPTCLHQTRAATNPQAAFSSSSCGSQNAKRPSQSRRHKAQIQIPQFKIPQGPNKIMATEFRVLMQHPQARQIYVHHRPVDPLWAPISSAASIENRA